MKRPTSYTGHIELKLLDYISLIKFSPTVKPFPTHLKQKGGWRWVVVGPRSSVTLCHWRKSWGSRRMCSPLQRGSQLRSSAEGWDRHSGRLEAVGGAGKGGFWVWKLRWDTGRWQNRSRRRSAELNHRCHQPGHRCQRRGRGNASVGRVREREGKGAQGFLQRTEEERQRRPWWKGRSKAVTPLLAGRSAERRRSLRSWGCGAAEEAWASASVETQQHCRHWAHPRCEWSGSGHRTDRSLWCGTCGRALSYIWDDGWGLSARPCREQTGTWHRTCRPRFPHMCGTVPSCIEWRCVVVVVEAAWVWRKQLRRWRCYWCIGQVGGVAVVGTSWLLCPLSLPNCCPRSCWLSGQLWRGCGWARSGEADPPCSTAGWRSHLGPNRLTRSSHNCCCWTWSLGGSQGRESDVAGSRAPFDCAAAVAAGSW